MVDAQLGTLVDRYLPVATTGGACAERAVDDVRHANRAGGIIWVLECDGYRFGGMNQQVASRVDYELGGSRGKECAEQVDEIPFAAGAEVQIDWTAGDQRGASAFHVITPCGPPSQGAQMLGGPRFDRETQGGVVAETNQIFANARVDCAGGGGEQCVVQAEQRFGPIREIEIPAMLCPSDFGDERIVSEPGQHLLVRFQELRHPCAQILMYRLRR